MTSSRARRIWSWRLATVVALALAVILGGAASAIAGLPPLTPITPVFPPWSSGSGTASLPATITGVVTGTGGVGLGGVRVQVFGDTVSSAIEAQSFSQSATTAPDGRFVIPDVIEGTYSMVINDQDASPSVPAYRETFPWYDWASWGYGGADTRHTVLGGGTVDVGTISLHRTGHVTGRAVMLGAGVPNSEVIADITNGGERYRRDVFTDASGYFDIANAPEGDWSLTLAGVGSLVPVGGGPATHGLTDQYVVTESAPFTFTLAAGSSHPVGNQSFQTGAQVTCNNWETYSSNSYQLSNVGVTVTNEADSSIVYTWTTDDTGHASRYIVPAGSFRLGYHDESGLYLDQDAGVFMAPSGSSSNMSRQMYPALGTSAIHGHITEAGTGSNVEAWISAAYLDGGAYASPTRRVISNGTGSGLYLIRVPSDTGLSGNLVRIDVDDYVQPIYEDPSDPHTATHLTKSFTVPAASDTPHDVTLDVGGRITGVVHDETGATVRGVSVSAERRAINPETGVLAWMNMTVPQSNSWWTVTDASGHYEIGGLPAGSDYKVVFNPDYNPAPWTLPIKYRDYYRRVYHSRPVLDSLNTSVAPIATDHDPVTVTAGATHSGIDETITPGGYVGLHASGPDYPTGAVYSDVMYRVGSAWAEVDSGFSTGGTFEKLWKVLPTGHYRLDYSDYFGRGAGSWEFDLAAGEHKYANIVVPMPMEYLSAGTSMILGSFDGLLNGGLDTGDIGGAKLSVTKLASLPATAPAPPTNYLNAGGIFDVNLSGGTGDGVWTLTLPYDPAVPSNLVGSLRVRHIKKDGTAEILVPFSWDTTKHTLMVQTTSLSPFQVMFNKTKVTLGKPSVPSKLRRNKRFTATGLLTPRHTAGAHSVRLYIYKWSSAKRRWLLTSKPWTRNSTYRSVTRWAVSLKLGKGKYRLTPVAPTDAWHLSTTGPYKAITIR